MLSYASFQKAQLSTINKSQIHSQHLVEIHLEWNTNTQEYEL